MNKKKDGVQPIKPDRCAPPWFEQRSAFKSLCRRKEAYPRSTLLHEQTCNNRSLKSTNTAYSRGWRPLQIGNYIKKKYTHTPIKKQNRLQKIAVGFHF